MRLLHTLALPALASILVGLLPAQEGDVLEQSSAPSRIKLEQEKTILFLAGRRSHGYGAHEHRAGNMLMARLLDSRFEGLVTKHFVQGAWPPADVLAKADSIVVFCDGGGGHILNKHLDEFDALMKKGIGAVFLHYGVETVEGRPSAKFIDWIGGHFERFWSVNPHWVAKFENLPLHPITRGVKPFQRQDEWYFHMRFRPKMHGVTPILSAVPPESTMKRKDGPHSGNPAVRRAVAKRIPQHTAWAYDREDGGRGFGFTGLHFHRNFADKNFRKILLNAIAWTAKIDVPEDGIETGPLTQAELEANQDFPKPAPRAKRRAKKRVPPSEKKTEKVSENKANPERAGRK